MCEPGVPRARSDLPDAPDADLDAEPEVLLCPITRAVFRDPVVLFDSGHTYERSAVLAALIATAQRTRSRVAS